MHITALMVVTYILCCARIRTAPWKYWQLNARYFSARDGIFSKLQLDELIPACWRLPQQIDRADLAPTRFPVFLKPEWGQNASGIHRADDAAQLASLRARLAGCPGRYLLQEAAPGQREYEIFGIDAQPRGRRGTHDVLTITEAVNTREAFPINSKFNRDTRYVELTQQFSDAERSRLSGFLSALGQFGISRLSVRADSRDALLAGDFHVIEINLFVPMPINLLDASYDWRLRWRFIRPAMMALARATRAIEPVAHPPAIFSSMMSYGRRKRRESGRHTTDCGRSARGAGARRHRSMNADSIHSQHGS